MTHYELLGVHRDVGPEELLAAWRAYARNPNTTTEAFTAGKVAFETLADPARRADYDLTLQGSAEVELRKVLKRELTTNEQRGVKLLRFAAKIWALRP